MANEDTVKRDETLGKRVTRVEAILRKLLKAVEIHWGLDIDGDGKRGNASIALMLLVVFGFAVCTFAADTTIWGLRPSATETVPDCYVTSDGTDCTLVVNKWTGSWTGTTTNFTVAGRLQVTGVTTNIGAVVMNNLTVNTNATVSGTLGVTGNLTAAAKVSEYGYPVVVGHTNGSAQVYIMQAGSFTATGVGDITNTFPVACIATPLYYDYRITGGVFVNTNAITIASNSMIIAVPPTSGVYMVYGRIK